MSQTEKSEYDAQEEALFREFPAEFQDLIVHLFLVGETAETISHIIFGICGRFKSSKQEKSVAEGTLYFIEQVQRRLRRLASEWESQQARTTFETNYDEKAAYLRRQFRNGLQGATGTQGTPPEMFQFKGNDASRLVSEYDLLPGGLQKQVSKRLRAGDCTEAVAHWLAEQPERGSVQHLTYTELMWGIEYRRRFLYYAEATLGARSKMHRAVSTRSVNSAKHRAKLLSEIGQLPDPLYDEFTRLLLEGGEVQKRVFRWARALKESIGATTDVGAEVETTAPKRKRKQKNDKPDSSFRTEKEDGLLRTLGQLPPYLLEETVRLLAHGAKGTVVARFILSHTDLGPFPRLEENSLRQYCQHLRKKVLVETKPSPDRKRLIHLVAKQIRTQQLRRQQIALARGPGVQTNKDASPATAIRDVEPLASLKQRLAALFLIDPNQLLADAMDLRSQNS